MPRSDDPAGLLPPDVARARAARLEARLAVYAQYAAVVAEQAAATLAGDEPRAAALAETREQVAEHFGELRAPAGGAGAESFGAALDDALAELAHQGAVDAALGARLAALREAALRGAAWAASEPPSPALRALPAGAAPLDAPADAAAVAGASGDPADSADSADPIDPVDAVFGGALVAARAAGVGGALDGHFPGRAARDDYAAGWPAGAPTPGVGDLARVDIRF
jgi:hypothetical protein